MNRALSSHAAILDGEIVAFDEHGRPSFAALQRRMHVGSPTQAKRLAKDSPVTYMIFDLLWLDGHSLMGLTYEERRELLDALALSGDSWQTPGHLEGRGRDVLKATAEQQLEGIVAKRLDAPYEPGARSSAWIKIKNVGRQELVIGGWLRRRGAARAAHRRAARRRVRPRRRLPLRRARRHRLQRRRARAPRQAARTTEARGLAVHRRRAPAARRRLRRARARRRGRVHRVDLRRRPAPPLLQGAARGQGRARSRARGHAACGAGREGDDDGRGARAEAVEPRQGALSRGRLHQARRDRLLFRCRDDDDRPPAGPRADGQALAGRRRREGLL